MTSSRTIAASIDTLERAIQALDVGMQHVDHSSEDGVQVVAAYNELCALVAEHTEMEDDVEA